MKLWKHQQEALERSHKERDLALFFEMGAGKTLTACHIVKEKFDMHGGNIIIACPQIVIHQWHKTLLEVGFELDTLVVCKNPANTLVKIINKRMEYHNPAVFIINYEKMRMPQVLNTLKLLDLTAVVFDESHKIKAPKAPVKVYKRGSNSGAAVILADRARHRYILTGSPVTRSYEDIFQQYRCLDGGEIFGKSFTGFRYAHFNNVTPHLNWPTWKLKPGHGPLINELMAPKCMKVLKKDCMDLPDTTDTTVEVELSTEQKRLYKQMSNDFIAFLDRQNNIQAIAQTVLTQLLRLHQITCGFVKDDKGNIQILNSTREGVRGVNIRNPRLSALWDVLEPLMRTDQKVVVWAHYRQDVEAIQDLLSRLKVSTFAIHGGVKQSARPLLVQAFKDAKGACVMIANQSAAGTGLDGLQCAKYAVYYSKDFSLINYEQSRARTHRGGSEVHDHVTYIHLECPNTIDSKVNAALAAKNDLLKNIMHFVSEVKNG